MQVCPYILREGALIYINNTPKAIYIEKKQA
jgi:hypothetical protein